MEGGVLPLIARQGGKYLLYKKIISEFPPNYEDMTYVEPFIGGGSVFFNKEESKKQIINDKDTTLYDFYILVKNKPKELEQLIHGLYNEDDFYEIKKTKPTSKTGIIVRMYLLKFLSYLGSGLSYNTTYPIRKVNKDFDFYSKKLRHTTILNKDYKTVIEKYDSENTFFYLDPPYELSTESISEYDNINLDELASILTRIKGLFLLSINNSKRTRTIFKSFNIKKVKTLYTLKRREMVELLISNY